RGGNLSYRDKDKIVITASGAPLGKLLPTDLVTLSLQGDPLAADGPRRSSEWALHVAAYHTRKEAHVVLHAHPPKAIALGLLHRSLPALTPDQYLHLGPQVPLLPYLTPTTPHLARAVAETLQGAPAVLLQNHGVLVTAPTPDEAHLRLLLLEEACAIFLDALAVGAPHTLSQKEMEALDEVTGGRYKF
ncbi:MAG: class II aldolase/adducin family protein, partial [Ardenticatenales bacterium]|nr:class II aldolase/adducin family protein [Ardenticatenales bacterium]